MSIMIDESDPCAAAAALRAVYLRLIGGQQAMSVSFKAGSSGVERAVSYHRAEPDRLLAMIRGFEQDCARLQGTRPRRFAIGTGGVR